MDLTKIRDSSAALQETQRIAKEIFGGLIGTPRRTIQQIKLSEMKGLKWWGSQTSIWDHQ